jgi:ribulose-phosphate 3-epimerase
MSKITIAPTVVPQTFADITDAIGTIESFADILHVDIDDGLLSPHLSWPYLHSGVYDGAAIAPFSPNMEIEAHLMVEEPEQIGVLLAQAHVTTIMVHAETFSDEESARRSLHQWREAGASTVVISFLIDTALDDMSNLVPLFDGILLMSIAKVGAQGYSFDERVTARVREAHEHYPEHLVAVDGGITAENIAALVRAGARKFSVGSAIMNASDPKVAYEQLKDAAENALQ